MIRSMIDDSQSKVSTASTFDKIKTKKRSLTKKRKNTSKVGKSQSSLMKKKNIIWEEEETKSSMYEAA